MESKPRYHDYDDYPYTLQERHDMLPPIPKDERGREVLPVRTKRKIGRNEPCPCLSGKKYKKCHGK